MKYVITTIVLYACGSFASECQYEKVNAIQSQLNNVLIQLKQGGNYPWKNLGAHGAAHTASYLALAQHALASGKEVVLRYQEERQCLQSDYEAIPVAFRVYR